MGWLIAGVISFIIGVILFFVAASKRKSLFSVLSSEKRNCKQLVETAKSISDEIGAGSFNERCRIWGKIESSEPLISELTERECVYYRSAVYRKYETTESYTDEKGNSRTRRVTQEECLSSNTNQIPFYLNDGTGKVEVSLEGAVIEDTVKVLDRFVPGESSGSALSFGRFSFSLSPFGGSRTLGYRYEESIIPVNNNLFVVGEASDGQGYVRIQAPHEKGYKYLVTMKSEEEYVKSLKGTIQGLSIAAPILTGIGVVLSILQFVIGKKL